MSNTDLFIFARFYASVGMEEPLAAAMREVVAHTSQETGCRKVAAYQSPTDSRLFYIHSHWESAEAFDAHGSLPHTVKFMSITVPLLERRSEIVQTRVLSA